MSATMYSKTVKCPVCHGRVSDMTEKDKRRVYADDPAVMATALRHGAYLCEHCASYYEIPGLFRHIAPPE
jgi:uncharacterized protein YbaR (Trm112 family)